ncbi:MAG: trypsin-like peptidase domain-containing protein [Bdellovibrionia bacterium]
MKIMRSKKPVQVILFLSIVVSAGSLIYAKPYAEPAVSPTSSPAAAFPADANVYVNLAKKIIPSVVNISSITNLKSPFSQGPSDDVLRKFFGDLFRQYNRNGRGGGGGGEGDDEDDGGGLPPMAPPSRGQKMPQSMSLGTGFIIDSSGLILTNNHVVAEADEIKISFTEEADEKPSDAEVVGRDPEIDVALIKVKNKRTFVPVVLGDSDALEVGEYVMAAGNPFGQGHSVSHGIISAKGRIAPDFPLANYLQTDAPINPGNSGGPLINLKGEVIGINNAIDQRAQGIGFAIPINLVKKVLSQLRTKGAVSRGFIGVLVANLTPEIAANVGVSKDSRNPVVTHVYPGEPADQAGIRTYDVILEFNGKPILSGGDLMAAVTALSVGDTVPLKISRSGKEKTLSIKVGQRPGQKEAGQKIPRKKSKKTTVRIDTGMTLEELTPEIARDLGLSDKPSGVVISNVAYGSAADKAGLMRGDIVLEVDKKPIKDVDAFYSVVNEKKSYLVRVRRKDPQGTEGFLVLILNLRNP